ncbi:hypothetical protein ACFP6A_01570 [Quadrisphaera sp. GCM10027208]|jgi:hypothetical protein|uniref:hypothetical protein n=1 Tax=Quadrisphaera sp. GCM10027208 TaxID=3273423 RepID=UPI003608CEEB
MPGLCQPPPAAGQRCRLSRACRSSSAPSPSVDVDPGLAAVLVVLIVVMTAVKVATVVF